MKKGVREKMWAKTPAVHVILGRGRLQTDADRKLYLELRSARLWGGSGIVAGPDRVRRGEEGGTGVHGQRLPLRSGGAPLVGGGTC